MPSFEWNKIIASVLTAAIVAMVAGILASEIIHPHRVEHPVYLPPGAEEGAKAVAAASTQAPPKLEPIGPFLVKANAQHGEQVAKVCLQCHTFKKGEPNKIGPNLFGVMEENIAAVPGYQFSQALAAHKSEKWDPDKLNEWLFKPQEFAKGTKMSFPGLPKEQDRADVIAYLETLGPNGEEMLKQAKEKAAAAAKQEEKKPAGAATPAPGKTGEKAPAAPEKSGGAAPAQQAPAGVPANPPAGPNATK